MVCFLLVSYLFYSLSLFNNIDKILGKKAKKKQVINEPHFVEFKI